MAPPVFFSRGKLVFGAGRRGSRQTPGFRAVSLGVAGEGLKCLFLRRRRGRAGSWRRCEASFGRLRPLEPRSRTSGDRGVLQWGVLVEYTRPSLEQSALSSTEDAREEGRDIRLAMRMSPLPCTHPPCSMAPALWSVPGWAHLGSRFISPSPHPRALSRWQMARKVAHSALG